MIHTVCMIHTSSSCDITGVYLCGTYIDIIVTNTTLNKKKLKKTEAHVLVGS